MVIHSACGSSDHFTNNRHAIMTRSPVRTRLLNIAQRIEQTSRDEKTTGKKLFDMEGKKLLLFVCFTNNGLGNLKSTGAYVTAHASKLMLYQQQQPYL